MTSRERRVDSNHRPFNCLFNSLCGPTLKKNQSLHYWPFVTGIHRWPVNSPHKGPVTRKSFHLMTSAWIFIVLIRWFMTWKSAWSACLFLYNATVGNGSCLSFSLIISRIERTLYHFIFGITYKKGLVKFARYHFEVVAALLFYFTLDETPNEKG